MAKLHTFSLNFTEEQCQAANEIVARMTGAINAAVAELAAITPDTPKGNIKNVVAHGLLDAAAQLAIGAARHDFTREPKRHLWMKSAGEAFASALSRPIRMTFTVSRKDGGEWTWEEVKP